jgi:hypothetical protein
MAIKYLSSLNLNNNELQNAAVHVLAAPPTSPTPVIGQVYYNSGDSSLYVCTVGGATPTWVVVGTEGTATSSALGSIKLFSDTEQSVAATSVSATAARTYGVQLNSDSRAVVNVPWTNTTYGIATDTTPGLIELFNNTDQSVVANTVTATAGRTYGIQLNADNQAVVNVPWINTNTTYSAATTTTPGLIELEDATVQTVAANTVTATASRTYGLQVNSDGQGVINVPWTDTVYTHPSYTNGNVESIDINTGTLTGATVISGLLVDIVTDTLGHVTSVNSGISTRSLTLANLGYTGATNANYITNNNQLTNGAGFITSLTGVVTSTGNATAIADAALSIAKTNGLQTALNAKAALASPALSGTPTAPTAAAATNTTQIATTAFVRTEVANLVASAPEALNTLDELAAALGDNANFATTTATSIGLKAPIANPTFTGTVTIPTGASITAPTITGAGAIAGVFTGNLTGNVTGNAATASKATNVDVSANNTTNETTYITFVDAATGTKGIETDTALTYNPSTNVLTAETFAGSLTGNVTGNVTGSSGSTTGNAATATNVAYSGLTGTVPTWNQNTTGNATTATKATNIAGGLGGSIPYQTAVNTTSLLANGSAGQVLQSNGGTAAPTWVTRTKSYNLVHASGTAVSGSVASNGNKTWTITHGMGASLLYMVQVIQISGTGAGETIFTDVTRTTTEVVVTFNTAPTSGEYTVVIVKI